MENIYDNTVHSYVEVKNTPTDVLPEENSRDFLILQNNSDVDMYIAFGQDAALNQGVLIPSKGNLMLDQSVFTARVSAIHGSTGDKRILVTVAG